MLFVDYPDDKSRSEKPSLFIAFFSLFFFYIAILSALEQTHCTRMRDFTPFAHKLFSEIVLIFRPKNLFAVLLHPLLKRYLYKFYIIHPTVNYTAFTYFNPKLFTELLRSSLSNCLRGSFTPKNLKSFKFFAVYSAFT